MQPAEIATAVAADSLRRLALDAERGFEFLRTVPSSHARQFVDFWTAQSNPDAWSAYLQALDRPSPGNLTAMTPLPDAWNEFQERQASRWSYRPFGMRRTLGLMLEKAGRLPPQLRTPDASDEEIRAHAHLKWPSEKQVIAAFARSFDLQRVDNPEDGHTCILSSVAGCRTTLVVLARGCALVYAHEIEGLPQPFALVDHGASWGVAPWDLITDQRQSLTDAVNALRKIVDDFEQSVLRCLS